MSTKAKFLSDIGYSTLMWGVGLAAGFVLSPLLARMLGEYEFGLWSITRRLYTALLPLALMGLSSSVVRYVPMTRVSDPERARKIAGLGSNLTALSALIVGSVLVALGPWVSTTIFGDVNLIPLILVVACTVWLDAQVQTLTDILRSFGFVKDQSTMMLLGRLLNLALSAAFAVLISPTAKTALWGVMAGSVVMLLLQVAWGLHRRTPVAEGSWNWSVVKDLLVYGVPRIPGGFLLNMILSIDSFFVGAMMGVTDAGHYGVATTLFGVVAGAITPISTVAFPLFSEMIGLKAKWQIQRYLTALISFALFSGVFLAAVTAILARPIVLTLYTEVYGPAIAPLTIIMIGAVFYALYIALRGFISAYTVKPVLVYYLAIGLAINIGLNTLLIPHYRAIGAAIGTASAYTVLGILSVVYTLRVWPLDLRGLQITRMPLAILPPVLVAWLARSYTPNFLLVVLWGGLLVLVYVGMLWLLKIDWFMVARDLIVARAARLSSR